MRTITLVWDGETADDKVAFVVAAENDGWRDLRIELCQDDCDAEYARQVMQEIMDRCNAANPKPVTTEGKEKRRWKPKHKRAW